MDTQKSYKILEIDRSASMEEAKQAYRDLIAVWHPDRYTHNPRLQKKALDKMKTVNAAFEVVSRFITENGPGTEAQKPASVPKSGANLCGADAAIKPSCEADRTATWAKTETRLAALTRAKEIAAARKAAYAEEAARIAALEEKKRTAARKLRIEAEKQARVREKKAAEKAILEKKRARKKAWEETEKKLRMLKRAKKKSMADSATGGNRAFAKATNQRSPGWYLKQISIGCIVLLAALSANALQTGIHFNFTSILIMIGSGFFAWWLIARFSRPDSLKK